MIFSKLIEVCSRKLWMKYGLKLDGLKSAIRRGEKAHTNTSKGQALQKQSEKSADERLELFEALR